jgi:hypothetical protein
VILFCLLHGIGGLLFALGSIIQICTLVIVGLQYFSVATWLLSTGITVNLLLCVFSKVRNTTLHRIQYFLYGIILGIPLLIVVVLFGGSFVGVRPNPNQDVRYIFNLN